MKNFSNFLFNNPFGSKMKKGFTTSRKAGDGSTTSTLKHQNKPPDGSSSSPYFSNPTLEEMILQLDIEEESARKKAKEEEVGRRMSCVNSSDILRSARNALNQYPRFSLDGKDAMYRSSFRNLNADTDLNRKVVRRPRMLGGESVVWCKPGVVAKLMGLDAIPVPIGRKDGKEKLRCFMKKQEIKRRAERHEMKMRLSHERFRIDHLTSGSRSNTNLNYHMG